jgi:hypothetical protein
VVLGFIASRKLHVPEFLSGWEFLTYGRVWSAYNMALIYGWCSLAGMGVATWLIGRLTRVAIQAPGILQFGAWFWNIGVAAGVVTLLAGYNSGLEYFEMHRAARVCMFVGYLLIGVWGSTRKEYGATKLMMMLVAASILIFVGIFGAFSAAGLGSFDMETLFAAGASGLIPRETQILLFPMVAVGCGTLAGLWPMWPRAVAGLKMRSCCWVRSGRSWRSSATAPDTSGADIEVPLVTACTSSSITKHS